MKYNLENKKNKFAERTLKIFSETLFELLEKNSFEKITVNEICEISNYPRATFYNYFEDINDLLNYCFESMSKEIKINDYVEMKEEERIYIIFDRLYNYMEQYEKRLKRIIRNNDMNGIFIYSLKMFLKEKIVIILKDCNCILCNEVPPELMAEYYSDVLRLLLYWAFCKNDKISKEKTTKYLKILLGNKLP